MAISIEKVGVDRGSFESAAIVYSFLICSDKGSHGSLRSH